jgi:hypothetical protein
MRAAHVRFGPLRRAVITPEKRRSLPVQFGEFRVGEKLFVAKRRRSLQGRLIFSRPDAL